VEEFVARLSPPWVMAASADHASSSTAAPLWLRACRRLSQLLRPAASGARSVAWAPRPVTGPSFSHSSSGAGLDGAVGR
jgi:hypothetical protein